MLGVNGHDTDEAGVCVRCSVSVDRSSIQSMDVHNFQGSSVTTLAAVSSDSSSELPFSHADWLCGSAGSCK